MNMPDKQYRALTALLVVVLTALALTSLADRAGAQGDVDFNPGGLVLEAGLTGPDGADILIQLEGCPADSLVRVLVDNFPTNDFTMPASGRLTATLDIPSYLSGPFQAVKAYCFATQGFVFADIAPAEPPDPDPGDADVFDAPDCRSVLGSGGNTFVADQGYRLVALFYNDSPLQWDLFADVETGDELTTSTGDPILKLKLCGPRGKPGYTPGQLFVEANLVNGGANIAFTVIGCAAGTTVHVFVDGVWQNEFVVPGNDQLGGQIATPVGLPLDTLKAICGERSFGFATIGGGGDVQDLVPRVVVPPQTRTVSAPVQADPEPKAEAPAKAVKKNIVVPAFEDGVPTEGTEGSGQRSVVNPVVDSRRASAPSARTKSIPQPQLGFGVLSAAGLLAFGGLRRASKHLTDDH